MLITDKKEVVRDAEEAREETQIFTDGSEYHGSIGTAAVLRRPGKPEKILCFHLGSDKHYMVFNGEQVGMVLGVELLRREWNIQSAYMGIDNQAAILATTSFSTSTSHSLTDIFIDSLNSVLKKHDLPHLTIRLGTRPRQHHRQ